MWCLWLFVFVCGCLFKLCVLVCDLLCDGVWLDCSDLFCVVAFVCVCVSSCAGVVCGLLCDVVKCCVCFVTVGVCVCVVFLLMYVCALFVSHSVMLYVLMFCVFV